MFEFSFIKKYLTPSRKQLSVSLISILSATVITLVVWLVALFLSITEGIEKGWLDKLTTLNAPLRIQPTSDYFRSYYYQIDRYSDASHYLSKTLGEKARSLLSNPYNPSVDEELPAKFPSIDKKRDGSIKDPVKELMSCLEEIKASFCPDLTYQEIQISGALLRLDLLRKHRDEAYFPTIEKKTPSSRAMARFPLLESQSTLTQVCYLSSLPENNPHLSHLILPPSASDLNHLLLFAPESPLTEAFLSPSSSLKIEKIQTSHALWEIPPSLLPEDTLFAVTPSSLTEPPSHFFISSEKKETTSYLIRKGEALLFYTEKTPNVPQRFSLTDAPPLFSLDILTFSVEKTFSSPLRYVVKTQLQGHLLEGEISSSGMEISKINTSSFSPSYLLPEWASAQGILLAKQFRDSGVEMGDRGYLSYSAPTPLGNQEMRLPIYVCGFYDPGIMPVGNRSIFAPSLIPQTMNASDNPFALEKTEANQFFVWFSSLAETSKIKAELQKKLSAHEIDRYFQIETFRDYPFAKDLMQQFQSDKYLFTLVGGLILIVACTNIISLLILLVSNKKKEIAILIAMGAKRSSIGAIFAGSGALIGFCSCIAGLTLAFFTLQHIDLLVHFLSLLQGHEPFNAQFFGQTLPKELSSKALWFALTITPLLSLFAGLIPAYKAATLQPCDILRSQ